MVWNPLLHILYFDDYSSLTNTPVIEREELFVRGVGDSSDIVSKVLICNSSDIQEMYTFADKSGRKLCLRPEFTSSIMRAVLNERIYNKTNGYYYVGEEGPIDSQYGPAYRYERPQHGRYREFHQFGVEIIHCQSSIHDFQLLQLCSSILDKLSLSKPYILDINSLGHAETMQSYRLALQVLFLN